MICLGTFHAKQIFQYEERMFMKNRNWYKFRQQQLYKALKHFDHGSKKINSHFSWGLFLNTSQFLPILHIRVSFSLLMFFEKVPLTFHPFNCLIQSAICTLFVWKVLTERLCKLLPLSTPLQMKIWRKTFRSTNKSITYFLTKYCFAKSSTNTYARYMLLYQQVQVDLLVSMLH